MTAPNPLLPGQPMKRSEITTGLDETYFICPHCGGVVTNDDEDENPFDVIFNMIVDTAGALYIDSEGYCINWFDRLTHPDDRPSLTSVESFDAPCCGKRVAIGVEWHDSSFTQYLVACRSPAEVEYLQMNGQLPGQPHSEGG